MCIRDSYITRTFDTRQNRWVDQVDPDAPAMTLARALGLSPETFGWLEGAGDRLLQGERTLLDLPVSYTHLDVYKRQVQQSLSRSDRAGG